MSSVLIVGNPIDGTGHYGPFEGPEDANEYAERHYANDTWWVVEMTDPDTRPRISLNDFKTVASDDSVKTDLELTCLLCSERLCDVEHDDPFDSLLGVIVDHTRDAHVDKRLEIIRA